MNALDDARVAVDRVVVDLGDGRRYEGPLWRRSDGRVFVLWRNKPVPVEHVADNRWRPA